MEALSQTQAKKTITLTPDQSAYAGSAAKATAFVGGFGSGKTLIDVIKLVELKYNYPSVNFLYAAPTYPLIRDIFYPTLEETLEETGIRYKINKQEHIIYFERGGHILCRTLRPAHLIGFKVGAAFLDELDILKKDIAISCFNKVLARIRQPYPDGRLNQVFVSTTPEGFAGTHQIFVKDKVPGRKIIHASTRDNPYLPDDYVATLINSYPDSLIQAYLDGQFVNLTTGNVYNFDRSQHHTDDSIKGNEPLHLGVDFNVGVMFTTISVIREQSVWYGSREKIMLKPKVVGELVGCLDTPDLIRTIKEKYEGHHITIYPDSTGKNRHSVGASKSDLNLLKQAGFAVAPTRNPLVRDRVLSVNVGLSSTLLQVNTDLAPRLTECLEEQAYDANGLPDKSGGMDHGNDSLGYFIYHKFPVDRGAGKVISV